MAHIGLPGQQREGLFLEVNVSGFGDVFECPAADQHDARGTAIIVRDQRNIGLRFGEILGQLGQRPQHCLRSRGDQDIIIGVILFAGIAQHTGGASILQGIALDGDAHLRAARWGGGLKRGLVHHHADGEQVEPDHFAKLDDVIAPVPENRAAIFEREIEHGSTHPRGESRRSNRAAKKNHRSQSAKRPLANGLPIDRRTLDMSE